MKTTWIVMLALVLSACATNKPVLYSSSGTAGGGQAAIAECHNLAVAADAQPTGGQAADTVRDTGRAAAIGGASGAVGGALVGAAGRGAGIGLLTGATAGLIHSIFSPAAPNPAYRAFVERCLRDKGFDPVGWQ